MANVFDVSCPLNPGVVFWPSYPTLTALTPLGALALVGEFQKLLHCPACDRPQTYNILWFKIQEGNSAEEENQRWCKIQDPCGTTDEYINRKAVRVFLRLNGHFPGLAELNIKSTVRHLSFWWHLSNGSSHLVWSKHHCDHRPCRSFAMLGAKAVRIPRRRIAASASQTRCQNTVRTTRLDPGNHRSPQRCGSFVPRGLHAWPPTCQAENQGDYTWNMTLRTSSWLTVAMLISFRPWKSNRCTARSYCPAPQCLPAAGSDPYGLCLKTQDTTPR